VEAANHYIALGEAAGIKELESHMLDWGVDHRAGFSNNERLGWVCRIVFQPRGENPLRAPRYGGLSLPWNSVPLTRWPLYPVACSGSTYFVLSEGYTLAGDPEDPKDYLHYCRTQGRFRTERLPVPTRGEALKDLESLGQSAAWKAIKWTDSGQGFYYMLSEEGVWAFMLRQAKKCPNK
jgi:hypothetical protein